MSKFVTLIRNSLIIAAALGAAAPAFAETLDSSPTLAVSYGDLNLSSTSGQSRLHHRLAAAAHSVCEGTLQPGTRIQSAHAACIAKAMTTANTEFALAVSKSQAQVAVR